MFLGFREIDVQNCTFRQWRTITVDTGAAHSTLQDIKVPEYGGGYKRVYQDVVELWEESLDVDLKNNYIQLRFADTPVLEGISIHETTQNVFILLATVSSVHRIRLLHPQYTLEVKGFTESIFSELTPQTLKDHHNMHILNNLSLDSMAHTAGTYLSTGDSSSSSAIFVLAQANGCLLVVKMAFLPYSVHVKNIKSFSFMNRLFTGFVPGMFRNVEGGEIVSSIVLLSICNDSVAAGICHDGRLRIWSCSKLECLLAQDVLESTAEAGCKLSPSSQRHLIRLYSCGDIICLGVFLSFAEKQMIVLYQPTYHLGQVILKHIKTLYPPNHDIVDFVIVKNFIWCLWLDGNNETQLLYASVNNHSMDIPGFRPAILGPILEKDVVLSDLNTVPKEFFLKELFSPQRFSLHTLCKSLGIYRRNMDASIISEFNITRLADEVERALQNEIENHFNADMTEEEIIQITVDAWSNFYSHTLQYHYVGQKPIGIIGVDDDLVGIVRKHSVSWIRPIDALELLTLGSLSFISLRALADTPILSEDLSIGSAVVTLATPLRTVRSALDPDEIAAFSQDLLHLQQPDQIAVSIATSLLMNSTSGPEPLTCVLSQQISSVGNVVGAIKAYLRALQLDLGTPDALTLSKSIDKTPEWLQRIMSGRLGSALVAQSVMQIAQCRFDLCRDLLLLQHIILQLGHLPTESNAIIRSTLIPQTTLLTQAYFPLLKIANTAVIQPPSSAFDISRRYLAILSLPDLYGSLRISNEDEASTVLDLFFRNSGGQNARVLVEPLLSEISLSNSVLSHILLPLATTVAQLAWPISRCLLLVEFLVWSGQSSAAQDYIRLLRPWCEWNGCSRIFLLAVSMLIEGNSAHKATHLFITAMEGVTSEDYLGITIAGGGMDVPVEEAHIQYCLRVIRLLEQTEQLVLALEIAQSGMAHASLNNQGLAALYAVSFKCHLELEHHDEAFTSLMACPDEQRRKNCLRQFIVTLCERRCLKTLVGYHYGNIESDVINILENRARSADILVCNYYDMLYAFHIKKHNYKKAASVMYECGLRLCVEGIDKKGLKQQAKCYLACINCLRHIPKDHAWIVKPIARKDSTDNSPSVATKRSFDSDSSKLFSCLSKQVQVQVLELKDIEQEYELIHSMLKLIKRSSDISLYGGGFFNPLDTVSLLTHHSLFKNAIDVAKLFQLPLSPIFEGLATACLKADRDENKDVHIEWLAENGMQKDGTAYWWKLLEALIEKEESGKKTVLHNVVVTALLNLGGHLPAWLVYSYKKRNSGELIKIFVKYGLLEDAVALACQYIDGLLGFGTDKVGLYNALHSDMPAVTFPYTAIDRLKLELDAVNNNSHFNKLSKMLEEKQKKYIRELNIVSKHKLMLCQ